MSFNLSGYGRAIAEIVGGENDGEIVYLNSGENKRKKLRLKNINKKDINLGKSFELTDSGILVPIPNMETREVCYIAGMSGSGKSTYASDYIKNYLELNPKHDFYMFSRSSSDPVLDKLKPIRVPINQMLIEEPIDIEEELTGGCIVLFDDCDTINDKEYKQAVSVLKNDILEVGRKLGIYCVVTSHLINGNDKKDTRTILNETMTLTVFPASGSSYPIKYALKQYFGLDNKQIDKILKLPSRWVTVSKSYPQYVLYQKGAYLMNAE